MATAHHINLTFDLDGVLDMNPGHPTTTLDTPEANTSKDSKQRITASNTLVSALPTVATDEVCSVCMEDFQTEISPGKQVPCGHVFHGVCISTWLTICNSCPLCRSRCIVSGEDWPGLATSY